MAKEVMPKKIYESFLNDPILLRKFNQMHDSGLIEIEGGKQDEQRSA